MDPNDFMNLEIEDEIEGQDPSAECQQEETQEETQEGQQAAGEGQGEDEEVEFATDETYSKESWKIDPATHAEKETDKLQPEPVKKRIGQLRASLTEAARQRDVAIRDHQELLKYAQTLRAQLEETQKQHSAGTEKSLEAQVAAEEERARSAKAAYIKAVEEGNTAQAVDAQEALNRATAKAERFREELDGQKTRKPEAIQDIPAPQYKAPTQQQQTQQQAQVSTEKRDAWIAKNKWFAMDEDGLPENAESKTAIKAHNAAIRSGIPEGSDAYFAFIDNSVKTAHPQLFSTKKTAAAVPNVPSSRVAQQTNAGGKQKFIISPETVKLANQMGFTTKAEIVAFAKNQRESMRKDS